MRIFIAGAGNVGRSIASEMVEKGHQVTVMDPDPATMGEEVIPGARWMIGDACEVMALEHADLESFDIAIAATGHDQVNLVASLLAKTEFSVPKTVARINHPQNEWMFDDNWGVDVAVSTPRVMSALVEEAVSVGDFVRLFAIHRTSVNIGAITLPADAPAIGRRIGEITWPEGTTVVTIIRNGEAEVPAASLVLEAGDELLVLAEPDQEDRIATVLCRAPEPDAPRPGVAAGQDLLSLDIDDDDDSDLPDVGLSDDEEDSLS